jgi:hypothetical protein
MNETYKIPGTNIVLSFKDNGDGTHSLAGIAKLLGQNGGKIVNDTNPHSVDCYAIHAITDVVISAMTLGAAFSGSMSGITIKAGDTVMIAFTSITLTSGTAIVYNN